MNLEAASDGVAKSRPSISLPFPEAVWGRVAYAVYIIALTSAAFWTMGGLKPEWQSGKLSDYIALFLMPEASLVFFFLLGYSVICYLFLLIAPVRFSQIFLIRFGIYTGTLLALQYSILSVPVLLNTGIGAVFLVVWIFPLVVPVIHRWAVARWTAATITNILFVLIAVALVGGIWIGGGIFFLLAALTMATPFWSFLIALRATLWLLKNYETSLTLPRGLELAAWLAAYAFAWRFDILKMYELYAALPTQPPGNCYIATAAARGHPRFVQSWTVRRADGRSMQVNVQLQRLKCAELALMAVSPRLHKSLRQIYDIVGKQLARRIQNPWLADITYFLLKPCEWFAEFLLKIMISEIDSIAKRMYL